MRRPINQAGFTLIELLIAAAISLIVLGIIAQAIGSSGRTVNQYVTRSDLLEDTRTAGQLMADEVAKAMYIFPPGYTLTLGAAGYTFRNPVKRNGTWVTDQANAPILAFVQAPKVSGYACDINVESPSTPPPAVFPVPPPANQDGCVRFMAYYPVLRGDVMSGAENNARPANDSGNNAVWTIFEFTKLLPYRAFTSLTSATAKVPVDFSGQKVSGNMLADYIKPGDGFAVKYDGLGNNCRRADGNSIVATSCTDPNLRADLPTNPDYRNSVTRATFTLQGYAASGGGAVQTPVLSFAVAPRNLPIQ